MTRLRRTLQRVYAAIFRDPLFAEFFDGVGYANYGYWEDGQRSGRAASDALVDRLVARIDGSGGEVLDVACGHGGTTARLGHHFGSANVSAVNFAWSQIAATRCNAPGGDYAVMDAAQLAFADRSYDVVCCIEAAFHFETREAFVRRAFDALRPGGTLLLADVVTRWRLGRVPAENMIASSDEFVELLERVGFVDVGVEDVLDRSWKVFKRRYLSFVLERCARWSTLRYLPYLGWAAMRFWLNDLALRHYLLISARKP